MTEPPNWTGEFRTDGVRVELVPVKTSSGNESWIVTAPGRLPILLCPCCDRTMQSQHAAKLVADEVFPFKPGEGASA
jgi:hypothetical protein